MQERQVEKKLVDGVKLFGGCAYKFISPGNAGVPDRMVILPGGRILFAELKTDTGRLSKNQIFQITRLRRLGAEVYEVRGPDGVSEFLRICKERMRVMPHD